MSCLPRPERLSPSHSHASRIILVSNAGIIREAHQGFGKGL